MGTATLSSSHSLCGCGLAKSSLTRTRAMVRQPVATTATSACTQGLPGCSESCKAFPGTQKIAGRGQVRLSKRTVSTRRHAEAETSISQDSGDDKSASEEAAEPKILSQELGNVQSPASVWLPQPDTTDKSLMRLRFLFFTLTLGGRLGSKLRAFSRIPQWLGQLSIFRTQQVVLGNTINKLIGVFAAGIPVILAGGLAYRLASGKTLWDGIVSVYGALYKIPGVSVLGEVNHYTELLMNFFWLGGSFTFAILLGVVTEDIVSFVNGVRKGNFPVVADNHTLILNWNSYTLPLLRQISVGRQERGDSIYHGPVVILANRPKEDMDKDCAEGLQDCDLEIHTRSGIPSSIVDLNRVAAGTAKTIMLLNPPDTQNAGKEQTAAVLGVQTCRSNVQPRPWQRLLPQNICVQEAEDSPDEYMLSSAKNLVSLSSQRLKLTTLGGRRDMSMLLAQSAVQPGVASVYCTIVQQSLNGSEFYIREFKELTGMTFGAARRCFDGVIVVGYMRKSEQQPLKLNPGDEDILKEGDKIVALADTGFFKPSAKGADKYSFTDTSAGGSALRAAKESKDPEKPSRKRIIIAWFDHDLEDLVYSLGRFAPKGSEVVVICPNDLKGMPEKQGDNTPCKFTLITGEPTELKKLEEAGIKDADSLIVGGIEKQDPREADTLMLAMLLVLQDALVRCKRDPHHPLHVVSQAGRVHSERLRMQIRRPETTQVANYLLDRLGKGQVTAELLQPDELISGMMAQVAAEPDMAQLLTGFIYSSEGSEIYLRKPSSYHLSPDQDCSFEQLNELCRLRKETALGYIINDGGVQLNPLSSASHCFCSSDRVIVLAPA